MTDHADSSPKCRFCATPLVHSLVDLGATPLANAYVDPERAPERDPVYPLHARVCANCFLVQVEDAVPAEEIFSDYAYFSSYSASWVEHARRYAEAMTARLGLGAESFVVEVASNDGYLLRHFRDLGIPHLGIEPAANVAAVARAEGIDTEVAFFGRETALTIRARYRPADLIAANNVMAHVPDLNDFVAGFKALLADEGVITVEFPHLLRLMEDVQFDTIYHEHYSYFSLLTAEKILVAHGLRIFDVEKLPTNGGSLRIFATHADNASHVDGPGLAAVRAEEAAAAMDDLKTYQAFPARVAGLKADLLALLNRLKAEGHSVAAYGAAAKGNTLLNHFGIGTDLVAYVVDRNPAKQGRLMPGSRLPIRPPEEIARTRPDYVLILPWNLKDEIMEQMRHIRDWGGRFIIPVPSVRIL